MVRARVLTCRVWTTSPLHALTASYISTSSLSRLCQIKQHITFATYLTHPLTRPLTRPLTMFFIFGNLIYSMYSAPSAITHQFSMRYIHTYPYILLSKHPRVEAQDTQHNPAHHTRVYNHPFNPILTLSSPPSSLRPPHQRRRNSIRRSISRTRFASPPSSWEQASKPPSSLRSRLINK